MQKMNKPELSGPKIVIENRCIHCGKPARVEVYKTQFDAWRAGMLAQNAFYDKSADEREMIISGTHPKCWDEMFGGEE
jgi:hypothetical protein